MKRLSVVLLASFMCIAVFADAGLSFVDSRGVTVNLPTKPARIVSLAPELTEILFAVGAGDNVVGVTKYCNYPEETAKIAKIGGFSAKTISVEAILALKPDLILGSPSMHAGLADQFKTVKLNFAAFTMPNFESIYTVIEQIGVIAGNEAKAKTLVASLKKRAQVVIDKMSKLPASARPLVFWEVWHEPLMSAGKNTFISQLITAAGARNCFDDAESDWPTVSMEAVISRNPDYILSPKSHGPQLTTESISKRQGWAGIKAVKQGFVHLIDDDLASRAGPRFVDALELIAKIVHPELYK